MRETLLPLLRCPSCGQEGKWALTVARADAREVRDGSLTCAGCGASREISHGIVDLLERPPDYVQREGAGLARFADAMRADGWDRERVLQLPYVQLGYWYNQCIAIEQVLGSRVMGTDLSAGRRILDVGANTCWASAMFAERGLEVVALDISPHEMQGLRTADWWFDDKDVFFERVLSVMFAPALASESFDAVFCCEVLHHNHHANLRRTLAELYRVLKPGGQLIVVNEPARALRSLKLRTGADVVAYDGHEHAYLRSTYVRAARAAGFDVKVIGPWLLGPFSERELEISTRMGTLDGVKVAAAHAVRCHHRVRSAYLAWKTYVEGMSVYLVGTKPSRPAYPADEPPQTARTEAAASVS